MTLAGQPATTAFVGQSCVTTAFAPTITLSPMVIPGIIHTPSPIHTLFPIFTGFPVNGRQGGVIINRHA